MSSIRLLYFAHGGVYLRVRFSEQTVTVSVGNIIPFVFVTGTAWLFKPSANIEVEVEHESNPHSQPFLNYMS